MMNSASVNRAVVSFVGNNNVGVNSLGVNSVEVNSSCILRTVTYSSLVGSTE